VSVETAIALVGAAATGSLPAPQRLIEIDGALLTEEVDGCLQAVTVVDRLALPDSFVLVFRDPDHDVLRKAGLGIGAKVRISTTAPTDDKPEQLVWGEVTSIEVDYDVLGSRAVVRGYDLLHRLAAGRKTRTFQNMTYSDIVIQIADEADILYAVVDSGAAIDHVMQANQSDLDFLYGLARKVGFDLTMDEDTLLFRRPTESLEAPGPGDHASTNPAQLVWNHTLLEFRARMSAVAQVSEVRVRGWDVKAKKAIVGQATITASNARVSKSATQLAEAVGAQTMVVVDRPVADQRAADDVAKAIAEQVGSAAFEATGVAIGSPALHAGTAVSISGVDEALVGDWVVSAARHEFGDGAYRTHLEFSGRQDRSLLGLVANGSASGSMSGRNANPGIAIGVVTENDDPQKMARVKVYYPWLADNAESYWARLSMPSAGKDHGMLWVPEVGDEVVVAFEHGDIAFPIVVGSLWNGKATTPPRIMDGLFDRGKVKRTATVSPGGHKIMTYDAPGDEGMMLITEDRSIRVILGQSRRLLRLYSNGKIQIEAAGDLEIKAKGSIKVEAGTTLDLKASGNTTLKGAKVGIN
jgi:uncharacterized protein involved in type VI secretion and phage assembly